MYQAAKALIRAIYRILFRIEVRGEEHIPKNGGVIFCPNHRSNHDAFLIFSTQKRNLSFMAKDSLFRFPPLGWILKKTGVFPVKRGTGDIGAIRKAVEIVQNGNTLVMFPEGTRNKTDEPLLEFKSGAALVAKKGNGMLVPVAITGGYKLFSKVIVEFSSPISPSTYGEKPDLQRITEDLKAQVLQMITKEDAANNSLPPT